MVAAAAATAMALLILFSIILTRSGSDEKSLNDTMPPTDETGAADLEFNYFVPDSSFDGTAHQYADYLKTRDDERESLFKLGHYYHDMEQWERASEYYLRSWELERDDISPLLYAAVAMSGGAFPEEAERLFGMAMDIDPHDPELLLYSALFYIDFGSFSRADSLLRELLKVDPGNALAAYHITVMPIESDRDEMVALSRLAAESEPQEPLFRYNYALNLYQAGYRDEAVRYLKTLTDDEPSFLESWLLLLHIYREAGETGKARELLSSAIAHRDIADESKPFLLDLLRELN